MSPTELSGGALQVDGAYGGETVRDEPGDGRRRGGHPGNRLEAPRKLMAMTAEQLISFARGAPSLDIIDVEGLKAAAVRAFDADPAGVPAYGTSVGHIRVHNATMASLGCGSSATSK